MTIDQWLVSDEKFRPMKMTKWISRTKNEFQIIELKIYKKMKASDLLYCNTCGAMPDTAFGTTDIADPMACLKCFKSANSLNEFLT